ncbi:predicted protein [Plenodomus lingam JN3]|uniref:Predicted protein n=1 Tax=Leptosphaeria maculans (strain JN3 / isolate v23.1.3 / race Av1-4-5-6-7-8) TaxID=985895 RepID=E5A370_LEPMJ|nr:predicted protein [Plenodomus lingam JN3]CBX98083.1 predicted protein [Plenodomus lingam JN3]
MALVPTKLDNSAPFIVEYHLWVPPADIHPDVTHDISNTVFHCAAPIQRPSRENRCYNEHPDGQQGSGSNNNRFGGFPGGDRYRPAQTTTSSSPLTGSRDQNSPTSFNLSEADIKTDLRDRPLYPISCYGPGKGAPRQLIEGPVEISPEELRLRYYTLLAAGDEATAKQEEAALGIKMEQQLKAISDDIPGAIKYIEDGVNVHPNRIDLANGTASSNGPASLFGGTSAATANPFGKPAAPTNPFSTAPVSQPSAFGQASKPGFGHPGFGQPSNPAQSTSAFGQPSNPGQNASPFGQPSNSGQNASPFGASSGLSLKPSPFGQPSTLGSAGQFGKPAFGSSGFGQPSMPGTGSAFGQTSSVGQASAFGQPSAPGAASGFSQINALGQKPSPFSNPGFGQSGFGQPAQPSAAASQFGQAAQSGGASPFGQQTTSTQSPFGQPAAAPQSAFGQPAQPAPSPFGQAAQSGAQASPFGQAAQQNQPLANPFQQGRTEAPGDKVSPFASASSQPSMFGQPSKPNTNPFGAPVAQNGTSQPANPFLQRQPPAQAAATSGFGFPNQAATPAAQTQSPQPARQFASQVKVADTNIDPKERFKEGRPEEYEGEQGKMLEEIYRRVAQLGRFNEDEDIPLTPPKCEWIVPMSV